MRYDTDERVTPFGDTGGFTATRDGTAFRVLHTETFGWTICAGPNLDFVPTTGGGFAIGYASAESAIADALGDQADDVAEA
jgi:hypothetical protein